MIPHVTIEIKPKKVYETLEAKFTSEFGDVFAGKAIVDEEYRRYINQPCCSYEQIYNWVEKWHEENGKLNSLAETHISDYLKNLKVRIAKIIEKENA